MFNFKKLFLIFSGTVLLANSLVTVRAEVGNLDSTSTDYTISGLYSINNQSQNSDYKIDKTYHDKLKQKIRFDSEKVEDLFEEDSLKNLDDLSTSKSYLISNNILTRNEDFYFDGNEISFNHKYSGNDDDDFHMTKSDLYMALYKAKFGVINSRPLVFNMPSIRKVNGTSTQVTSIKGYTDSDGNTFNANFSEGDYYYYVSPNVYELYFTALLDKGMISKSEFIQDDEHTFIKEYEKLSKNSVLPTWHNKNSVANAAEIDNALGASYDYSSDCSLTSLGYSDFPGYFIDEKISVMEALSIIEDFMRVTEKEMTDTEAKIITYKYGVNYLSGLSKSQKKTVSFLIAKGILNFEENEEVLNYYETISRYRAIDLIYRFANQNARFDFSKVTITDTDLEWLDRGYAQDNITLYRSMTAPTVKTLESENAKFEIIDNPEIDETGSDEDGFEDDDPESGWKEISKLFTGLSTYAATSKYSTYKVTKLFDKKYQYTYAGTAISELKVGNDIVSIKDDTEKDCYIITFSVLALDKDSAISCVDNKIQCNISTDYSSKIASLTSLEDENGDYTTMIPASSIKENFPEITIVSDKVLSNSITGSQAVLLQESGYALVGSKIIKTSDILIKDGNDDVYYNLEVIASLLQNVYLKNIDAKINASTSMFISDSQLSEEVYSVYSDNTEINKSYVANFKLKSGNKDKNVLMYNMDTMTKGINTISRSFYVKDKLDKKVKVTLVLDLKFIVPTNNEFGLSDIAKNTKNGSLTVSDVTSTYYTRPDDSQPALQEWWDSNIGMSNALCNFMYGTKGQVYVDCGYLAPSLTILYNDEKANITNSIRNNLFKDFTLVSINGVSYSKYIGNNIKNFWVSYFLNHDGISNNIIRSLATSHVQFHEYYGTNLSDGYSYSTKFFMSDAGTLYRSIPDDDRVSINVDQRRLNIESRTQNSDNYTLSKGDVLTYSYNKVQSGTTVKQDSKWYYAGYTRDYKYIKLMPLFKAGYICGRVGAYRETSNGQATLISSPKQASSINGYYNYDTTQANLKSFVDSLYTQYFANLLITHPEKYNTPKAMFGANKEQTFIPDLRYNDMTSDYVLANGKIAKYDAEKKTLTKEDDYGGKTAFAIPIIYIPAGSVSCYQDSNGKIQLRSGNEANILNLGNLYLGNVNQNVIDAALFKDNGTIPVNDIPEGTKLYIGDTLFVKSASSFNSVPVGDAGFVSSLRDEGLREGAITNYFSGQIITIGSKKYPLTQYLDSVNIGRSFGITDKTKGVLCMTGSELCVMKNDQILDSSSSAEYANISITFKDGLYCRPLDAGRNVYSLLTVSNTIQNSKLDDLPFIGEKLNFTDKDKVDVSLDLSLYNISQFKNSAKRNFYSFFRGEYLSSLRGLAYMIIVCFASYIAVMSWVVFGILYYNIGKNFFLIIANPGRDKNHGGLDLIKIFTFGIYSLDSEITPSRCVVVTLISFIIITIIINWLPK